MTVTRSRCLDALRGRRGRRRPPTWLAQLSTLDREIYRLHFLEGRSYGSISEEFRRRGRTFSPEMLGQALTRIEARMDRGLRLRLAYDLQARSVGAISGRLLEFLDHLRAEQQEKGQALQPDLELVETQSRQVLQQIEACVAQLRDPERGVIQLYYYEGLAAPEIARRMALRGPRRVYTLIDRGVGMLRSMMGAPVLRPDRISHPEGEA
jgi:DNA-directed RNA polymerase specialized sigma24 family protein